MSSRQEALSLYLLNGSPAGLVRSRPLEKSPNHAPLRCSRPVARDAANRMRDTRNAPPAPPLSFLLLCTELGCSRHP